MYQVTGDTRIVKELLGHSNTAITERYTLGHVPEYMQVATDRFQALTRATTPSAVRNAGRKLAATVSIVRKILIVSHLQRGIAVF